MVVDNSIELLETALTVNSRLASNNKEAGSAATTTTTSNVVDDKIRDTLEDSVLLHVLRPLITAMCIILEHPRCYDMLSSLVPAFIKLLETLDKLNAKDPDALGKTS